MRKTEPGVVVTPTIQVIERMFALIDVLASREEAISLKEISEKTGLHPSTTHRILNDLAREYRTAIIVVTHDEKIIPTFKRIYHIRDGRTHEEAGEGRVI